LRLHEISRNVKETPDLEDAVDQAERTNAKGIDECSNRNAIDEDEHPQKH
jgi:hypothetical protein